MVYRPAILLILFWPAIAPCQPAPKHNSGSDQVQLTGGSRNQAVPVTRAECFAVLKHLQDSMASVAHIGPLNDPEIAADSDEPVTRAELVDYLASLELAFHSKYKLKPRTQYSDASVIRLPGPQKKKAVHLAKLGFVSPVGVLLVGPKPTLTINQFGDALGFFLERWCDMTHMPSTIWSPYLQKDPTPTPPSGRPVPASSAHAQPQV